jgi:hypothetical protein
MLLLTCGDAEKAHAESSANDEQTKASASLAPFPQAQRDNDRRHFREIKLISN